MAAGLRARAGQVHLRTSLCRCFPLRMSLQAQRRRLEVGAEVLQGRPLAPRGRPPRCPDWPRRPGDLMRTLVDIGYRGSIEPDHIPSCEVEGSSAGHGAGRAYNIGYLRGLLEAAEKEALLGQARQRVPAPGV